MYKKILPIMLLMIIIFGTFSMGAQITFKDEKNSYFDIILKFEDNNEGRKKTIDIIEYLEIENIKKWIKFNDLNLTSDFIREFNIFKCKFKLINKPFNSIIKSKKQILLVQTLEMIQIQYGIHVDNKQYVLIMNDEQMDHFEMHLLVFYL